MTVRAGSIHWEVVGERELVAVLAGSVVVFSQHQRVSLGQMVRLFEGYGDLKVDLLVKAVTVEPVAAATSFAR